MNKKAVIRPFITSDKDHQSDKKFGRVWIKDSDGSIATNKNLEGRYCNKPFTWLEIDMFGRAWMCCPSWLPYSIGNILHDDINEIWNGEKAQLMREQMFNGEWNYCNHLQCPQIQDGSLPTFENTIKHNEFFSKYEKESVVNGLTTIKDLPTHINFSNDESCNLKCPSCRIEKILYTKGSQYDQRKAINDKIVEAFLSEPTDRKFQIHVTGSGDPFASKIYREMLRKINGEDFPNLTINLQCNGVMFTPKMWDSISRIHKNLGLVRVSFDAGTKSTYENITRLGGHWDVLLQNCDFLNQKHNEFPNFKIAYDFVVQSENYAEMPRFVDLIKSRYNNAASIGFNLVTDWGTWSKEDYDKKCIWKNTHPEHEQFLKVLAEDTLDYRKIKWGNVNPYRLKAKYE